MERLVQAGKIEEVYYARLLPGGDILQAIYEICAKYDIKTGVILPRQRRRSPGAGLPPRIAAGHYSKEVLERS